MNKFLDKYGPWAMVTGASSGIGEQFCVLLAEAGFNIFITARREILLQALKNNLEEKYSIEVVCMAADLSEVSDQEDLLEKITTYDIGLLVSNAGFGYKGLFEDQEKTDLEKMIQVNLMAPTRFLYQLLPVLKSRASSGVIVTGSIEGETPFAYSAAYAATKAYVHSLVNGIYHEAKQNNVDVLLLAPGSTDTNAPISQGISRDQLLGIMQPEIVAAQALNSLGKKALLIPGLHNKFFIVFLRLLPRKWAVFLAGFGMKQAIDNSQKQ